MLNDRSLLNAIESAYDYVMTCRPVQACMRGLEADHDSSILRDLLDDASQALTLEQLAQVMQQLPLASASMLTRLGAMNVLAIRFGQRLWHAP